MTTPASAMARRGGLDFDDHPLLAIWELTQACDLVCAHCRACATPNRSPTELTTEEGKALLDRFCGMHIPLIVLTGGDPAKRPDLVELVRYGTSIGLTMTVTPSGTPLVTRELLADLKAAGLARLAVSVDGPVAEVHDVFRGVRGSFAITEKILDDARDLGIPLQINTSIGPHNMASLGMMADFVARHGAVLWSVFFVVPTGRAGQALLLGPKRTEALLEELASIAGQGRFDVKTTAAPHFRRVLMQRKTRGAVGVLQDVDASGIVRGPRGINDGVGFLFVSHTGDVFPSGFLPEKAGNVRTDDVATIYREHPLFKKLRSVDDLSGKCGACPFRRVCGGSRARAFATYGDPMAEDPLCAYVPRGYEAA